MKLPVIAVVGPGDCSAKEADFAETVGAGIARRGALLVCGGLGGVMEAASKGCAGAGGTVIGILPGIDRRDANPYVAVGVPTGLGQGRNLLIVHMADAIIAIGGGYGTLSEIALGLRHGKRVIGLHTWELRKVEGIDSGIVCASSPEDAVELAFSED